jgi:RNA polymerase sigma-70 factor (ECF subfamily)
MNRSHASSNADEMATRASLFSRLCHSSSDELYQSAWQEFFDRYTPEMYRWCRNLGMRHDDANEVVSVMIMKWFERVREFRYDASRSFRGWLKVSIQHVAIDLHRLNGRMQLTDGRLLEDYCSSTDVSEELDHCVALEIVTTARNEVQQALEKSETGRRDWMIYQRCQDAGESGDTIAADLNMTRQAVYVAKSRVAARIKAAIEAMGDPRA